MKKLILVMGLPGSGKSFFAERLASALGAEYLSSDRERNRMGRRDHYSPEDKLKVYRQLERLAKEALNQGKTVIIDATFYLQHMRDMFSNLAFDAGADDFYFYIKADDELIRERLRQPRTESQADFSVYKLIKEKFEPLAMKVMVLESKKDNIALLLEKALDHIGHGEN